MLPTTRSNRAWPELLSYATLAERRREARVKAAGAVELLVCDPAPQVITALLVDVSKSGFRALHQNSSLESGAEVRFRHEFAKGKARVIWSRVLPGVIESGFRILKA
jgi:hypothetical protein